jgi:hypothetical protein
MCSNPLSFRKPNTYSAEQEAQPAPVEAVSVEMSQKDLKFQYRDYLKMAAKTRTVESLHCLIEVMILSKSPRCHLSATMTAAYSRIRKLSPSQRETFSGIANIVAIGDRSAILILHRRRRTF